MSYSITILQPPTINLSVAGIIRELGGGGGTTIIASKFPGVTGLEKSYVAGGAGTTGGELLGKTAFLAFNGSAQMKLISTGTPAINEIKVVGNNVSWALELPAGDEIIIIAK